MLTVFLPGGLPHHDYIIIAKLFGGHISTPYSLMNKYAKSSKMFGISEKFFIHFSFGEGFFESRERSL